MVTVLAIAAEYDVTKLWLMMCTNIRSACY